MSCPAVSRSPVKDPPPPISPHRVRADLWGGGGRMVRAIRLGSPPAPSDVPQDCLFFFFCPEYYMLFKHHGQVFCHCLSRYTGLLLLSGPDRCPLSGLALFVFGKAQIHWCDQFFISCVVYEFETYNKPSRNPALITYMTAEAERPGRETRATSALTQFPSRYGKIIIHDLTLYSCQRWKASRDINR